MSSKGYKYYGPVFWVAIASFLVPFFVGWHTFKNGHWTKPTESVVDESGVDHLTWDYLLKSHVRNGLIDYNAIRKDYLFKEYLEQLATCNPKALKTDNERLALACNAYNAFVINGVNKHKISEAVTNLKVVCKDENGNSLLDKEGKVVTKGFFELEEHDLGGKLVSLDELEKEIILPQYKDPRVHVALVCGAVGCPAIRPEAYTGETIQAQLEDQSAQFANNPNYVRYNPETQELVLSQILEWYADDFDTKKYSGGYAGGYSEWLTRHVEDGDLKAQIAKAAAGQIKVNYYQYNWKLNSLSKPESDQIGGGGSGKVPE